MKIMEFLSHLAICMALALIVITILNGFNPLMSFLTSDTTKVFIFVFCGVVVVSSIGAIVRGRRGK